MMADPKWKENVYTQDKIAGIYLSMNVQFTPFDNDLKVRQAFSWAIDREKIVQAAGRSGSAL